MPVIPLIALSYGADDWSGQMWTMWRWSSHQRWGRLLGRWTSTWSRAAAGACRPPCSTSSARRSPRAASPSAIACRRAGSWRPSSASTRQTVTTVYGRLVAEGFLEGRAGGGTFVATTARPTTTAPVASVLRPAVPLHPATAPQAPSAGGFDLRIGRTDPSLFPLVEWRQCVVAALQQVPESYGDPAGLMEAAAPWPTGSAARGASRHRPSTWSSPPAPSRPSTSCPGSCSDPATTSRSRSRATPR